MAISASIQALISGEQVAGSKLSNKLLDELMAEGLLSVVTHGSRKSYRARDVEALKRYLIDKDESYRMLEVSSFVSRASLAAETGNSKLMTVRSCPGFPVNSYEPISCSLCDKDFVVNPHEGSFVFIDNWQQFSIPQDIVVGVLRTWRTSVGFVSKRNCLNLCWVICRCCLSLAIHNRQTCVIGLWVFQIGTYTSVISI